jgi:diguanylate cyclase (GGDEF)-like protein
VPSPQLIAAFWAKQSALSQVSAFTAFLFFASSMSHFIWSPVDAFDQYLLAITSLVAAIFIIVSLVRGSHFSLRWGLFGIFLAMLGIYVYVAAAQSEQLVLNVILLVPVIALTLGWFLDAGYARPVMLAVIGILVILVGIRGQLLDWSTLSATTAIYIALLNGFLFEAGGYVHRRRKRLASRDPLTGALNRFGFWRDGYSELKRSVRRRYPVAVVAIDFDGFKKLNDTKGHFAGDEALRSAVTQWRSNTRPCDLIARIGGDEFVLLLAGATAQEATALIRRLRDQSEVPWSWGIAAREPGESLEGVLERADAELLRSRRKT